MLLIRPRDGAKFCDQRVCLWVCLPVCLSARIVSKNRKTSQNFLYMLFVAVARSSGDSAICYLLPVLDEVA